MNTLQFYGADERDRTADLLITNHCTEKSMHGIEAGRALITKDLTLQNRHAPSIDSTLIEIRRNQGTSNTSHIFPTKAFFPFERLRE